MQQTNVPILKQRCDTSSASIWSISCGANLLETTSNVGNRFQKVNREENAC